MHLRVKNLNFEGQEVSMWFREVEVMEIRSRSDTFNRRWPKCGIWMSENAMLVQNSIPPQKLCQSRRKQDSHQNTPILLKNPCDLIPPSHRFGHPLEDAGIVHYLNSAKKTLWHWIYYSTRCDNAYGREPPQFMHYHIICTNMLSHGMTILWQGDVPHLAALNSGIFLPLSALSPVFWS